MPDITELTDPTGYYSEAAYGAALEAIAMGETRGDTLRGIVHRFGLSVEDAFRVLPSALHDALKQGVEREDIDRSWFIGSI